MEQAEHVIAIEKDHRAIELLAGLVAAAGDNLKIIEGDASRCAIWDMGVPPRRIMANLPYNIATSLLTDWLAHANAFESMTLMFQREVAERIIATPGTAAYGRLSIICQWLADCEILFDIPPDAFFPAPKVVSSVVQILPLSAPRFTCDPDRLVTITRLAFGQRRKMLRSSLKSLGGAAFSEAAGITPEKRPQDIDVAGFAVLPMPVKTGPTHSQRAIA